MLSYFSILKTAHDFYKIAEIMHPPQQKYIFVENFEKKIEVLISKIIKNIKHFNSEAGQDYIYDFLGVSFGDIRFITNTYLRDFEDMRWVFKYLLEALYENTSYLSILENLIRKIQELKEISVKFLNKLKNDLIKDYEENLEVSLKYYTDDSSYPGINKNDYNLILEIPDIFENIINLIDSFIPKLLAWKEEMYNYGKAPKSENTEILFHTTVNADKLLSNGFVEKWEQGEGLGGSNSTKNADEPGISFTSNLYVAKEILRTLKELIAIAHGKIKRNHILEWMRGEPFYDEVLKTARSIYGKRIENDDPVSVAELYKIYLAYASSRTFNPASKLLRYDPYYMYIPTLIENLKNKSEQDIGIVVAEIDMKDYSIEYLQSMDEYRVPLKAIKKIVKVIR